MISMTSSGSSSRKHDLLLQHQADAGREVFVGADAGLQGRRVEDFDDIVKGTEISLDMEAGCDHLALILGHAGVELLEIAVARPSAPRA